MPFVYCKTSDGRQVHLNPANIAYLVDREQQTEVIFNFTYGATKSASLMVEG